MIEPGRAPVLDLVHGSHVGRKTRTIPSAIRRALALRDPGCRFPGCTNRICDAHHVDHWADGGDTSLDNLVSLCRRHHTHVHELGFSIRRDPSGDLVFLDPNGDPIPATGAKAPAVYDGIARIRRALRERGFVVDPSRAGTARRPTTVPRWTSWCV